MAFDGRSSQRSQPGDLRDRLSGFKHFKTDKFGVRRRWLGGIRRGRDVHRTMVFARIVLDDFQNSFAEAFCFSFADAFDTHQMPMVGGQEIH